MLKATDEELLRKTAQGSKEALAILFCRFARSVRNVAFKILKNREEAEDLTQDIFLFIFRKAHQFDSALGNAGTWIIHVAYHRAIDRKRYLKLRRFYDEENLISESIYLAAPYARLDMEHSIQGVLGTELLQKFNQHLSVDQRRVIQLCIFDGYSLRDIAEATNQSIVNVRSHYYRGLERMRRYVLPQDWNHPQQKEN